MRQGLSIAGIMMLAACAPAPSKPASGNASSQQAPKSSEVSEDLSALAKPAPSTTLPPAACTAEETPIFSCTVKGGKRLSVCGAEPGAVQYRFGDEGAAELVLNGGAFASVPYSGGGEAQIKFENGEASYIVYSQVIRTNFASGEPNNPAITDGVVVLKDGVQIAQIGCDDPNPKPIDYFAAEAFLPAAPKLFADIDPSPARK